MGVLFGCMRTPIGVRKRCFGGEYHLQPHITCKLTLFLSKTEVFSFLLLIFDLDFDRLLGSGSIKIAGTQNVIANSILSKPFIRKATSAFELSCSYLVFNARTHFPAYV